MKKSILAFFSYGNISRTKLERLVHKTQFARKMEKQTIWFREVHKDLKVVNVKEEEIQKKSNLENSCRNKRCTRKM